MQAAVNDSMRSNVEYLASLGCVSYLFGRRALLPLPPSCGEESELYSSRGLKRMGTRRTIAEDVVSFCDAQDVRARERAAGGDAALLGVGSGGTVRGPRAPWASRPRLRARHVARSCFPEQPPWLLHERPD